MLSGILLFSASTFAVSDSIAFKKRLQQQSRSNEEYNLILSSFDVDGEIRYPDYYGGSYLDNAGYLVVGITEYTEENRENLCKVTGNNRLQIKRVDYSYNELMSVCKEIERLWAAGESATVKEQVVGFGIDEVKNRVLISIQDLSYKEKLLSYLRATDMILVEDETVESSASVNPGGQIQVGDGYYSVGFRCYYMLNGQYCNGFITAAHNNLLNESVYKQNENEDYIGWVIGRQFSGTVDASLVAISGSNTVTNTTEYESITVSTSTYTTNIAVNTSIWKEGRTTYRTGGSVLSNNWTIFYEGAMISGLIRSDYGSSGGDSGGIVYSYIDNTWVLVGITVAYGYFGSDPILYRYCCQAKNIVTALSVIPY